jgi:hypothetical protein
MDGLIVPINQSSDQVASFENDMTAMASANGYHSQFQTTDNSLMDIKTYLAKPTVVGVGTMDYVTTPLFRQVVDMAWLKTIHAPMANLKYAYGIRFDLKFRVQLASSPFYAGLYRLCWQPMIGTDVVNPINFDRASTATTSTMLPGVDIDLTEQTEAILTVPFCYYQEYLMMQPDSLHETERIPYGLVTFLPLLPAKGTAAGGPLPRYQIFMSLHNIQISGVTDAAVRTAVAQSGLDACDKESRPISSSIASAAGTISTIASLGMKTAWGLRWAAKTAYSFGFSKPVGVEPIRRVTLTNNTYLTNVDGPDISYNMGCFTDNHVAPCPGFAGSNTDEMTFDHILTKPCLISRGTIDTANVYGNVRYAMDLAPLSMYYQRNANTVIPKTFTNPVANTVGEFLVSPVFYLANVHSVYRGSFKITVHFAKTKFHYGRVALTFIPNATSVPSVTTFPIAVDSSPRVETQICDLKVQNRCEFICPFVSSTPYLPIDQPYGTFYMRVMESIGGPTNVTPVIDFAVYVECLPGFELAGTTSPLCIPAPVLPTNILAQSGFQDSEKNDLSEIIVGERIRSVKQLINKACVVGTRVTANLHTYGGFVNMTPTTYTVVNQVITGYTVGPLDYTYLMLNMFAMHRGSVSYSFTPLTLNVRIVAMLRFSRLWNPATASITRLNTTILSEVSNPLHVTLPYYGQYPGIPTNYSNLLPKFLTPPVVDVVMTNGAGSSGNMLIYRKAGEDFQMGYFIGPPPMCMRPPSMPLDVQIENLIGTTTNPVTPFNPVPGTLANGSYLIIAPELAPGTQLKSGTPYNVTVGVATATTLPALILDEEPINTDEVVFDQE